MSGVVEAFRKMGAVVTLRDEPGRRWIEQAVAWGARPVTQLIDGELRQMPRQHPVIDLRKIKGVETFVVDTFDDPKVHVQVIDVRPQDRHLLLKVGDARYLMGHDERHWFVAAIPESARAMNVKAAKEALKPNRVRTKMAKGEKVIRQGEWFFVPVPQFDPGGLVVFRKEPIRRTRGTPHICEELVRRGGELVHVHGRYARNGVSAVEKKRIIEGAKDRRRATVGWSTMVADAEVYVRGYVRHPDHSTIVLKGWHRVYPNTENKSLAFAHMRFLD